MNFVYMTYAKLHRLFMDLKLSHKLLLGYLTIILIPTIALEYSLYDQSYNSVRDQYLINGQNALDMAKKNWNIQIGRIQKSSEFLESNAVLTSYLGGFYETQSEELYYYIKDIKPMLDYLSKSDPAISGITFYGVNSYHLKWGGRLIQDQSIPLSNDSGVSQKDLIQGIWYKEPGNSHTLSYYRCLYNSNYSVPVATLRIDVSLLALMENFSTLSGTLLTQFSGDDSPMLYRDKSLEFVPEDAPSFVSGGDALCQIQLEEPVLHVYQILDLRDSLNYNGNRLLFLLLLLFFVLSAGYYGIATSITRRITRLQRHIRCTQADNLIPLTEDGCLDEVGQLTEDYNKMITRINQLIFQNYRTELEKKNAEFYALQAQIEPHFLYNILENIHMSAEQSGDRQTAEMAVCLGKFMRYNLSHGTSFVPLSEELLHAKNYLDIHKIRMQESLSVQIAVYTEIDDIFCPRFILQPLLENSIKYAGKSSEALTITITVTDAEPDSGFDAALSIGDNGRGIMPETLKKLRSSLNSAFYPTDSHIGLNSINNRLRAFYGSDHVMQIHSIPGQGTVITLNLRKKGKNYENTDC